MLKKSNSKIPFLLKIFLVLVLILVLSNILTGIVLAQSSPPPAKSSTFSSTLWSCLYSGIDECYLTITAYVLSLVSAAVGFGASILDAFIGFSSAFLNPIPPVVQAMWAIVKNFVNMFFIFILIIIAFATIFDRPQYKASELLPKVIMVALIINFSLVIGQTLIAVFDNLSHTILNQIQTGSNGLSGTLQSGLNTQKMLTYNGSALSSAQTAAAIGSVLKLTFLVLFAIIALVCVFFAFLVVAITFLVRIPYLWALLIFSPFAWIGWLLPNIKKQTWSKWWKEFMGWNLFAPVYLFILSFAIMFINFRTANPNAFREIDNPNSTFVTVFANFFSISDIFYYTIVLGIIIGGLKMAKEINAFTGTAVLAAANKIQGGIKQISGYNNYKGAVQQTATRIKTEGLPKNLGRGGWISKIYQGKEGDKLKEGGVATRIQKALGYGTTEISKQQVSGQKKVLSSATENMTSQQKEVFLRQKMRDGKKLEQQAAGTMLSEDKKLAPNEQIEHYNNLGGDTSETARQFGSKIDFTSPGWTPELRRRFFSGSNDAKVKGSILSASAKVGDLVESSEEELARLSKLFSSLEEKTKFLDAAQVSFAKTKEKKIKNDLEATDRELALLTQQKTAAGNRAKAIKEALDNSNSSAKSELERQFSEGRITEIEMANQKKDLAERTRKAKEVLDAELKEKNKDIDTKILAREKEIDIQVKLSNPAFNVKLNSGLIRDPSGASLTNPREAIEFDGTRIQKVQSSQQLDSMFKKIGDEIAKQSPKDTAPKPPAPEDLSGNVINLRK